MSDLYDDVMEIMARKAGRPTGDSAFELGESGVAELGSEAKRSLATYDDAFRGLAEQMGHTPAEFDDKVGWLERELAKVRGTKNARAAIDALKVNPSRFAEVINRLRPLTSGGLAGQYASKLLAPAGRVARIAGGGPAGIGIDMLTATEMSPDEARLTREYERAEGRGQMWDPGYAPPPPERSNVPYSVEGNGDYVVHDPGTARPVMRVAIGEPTIKTTPKTQVTVGPAVEAMSPATREKYREYIARRQRGSGVERLAGSVWQKASVGGGAIPYDRIPAPIREALAPSYQERGMPEPKGWDPAALAPEERALLRHLIASEQPLTRRGDDVGQAVSPSLNELFRAAATPEEREELRQALIREQLRRRGEDVGQTVSPDVFR